MPAPSRRQFLARSLATALSPFYAAGQTGALRVRPVLQNLTPRGVTIFWLGLEEGSGRLDFARRGQPPRSVATRTRTLAAAQTGLKFALHLHRADLSGLDAATDYAYTLLLNGRPVSGAENLAFRTPGRSATRLVALGDSGNGSPEQLRLATMMNLRQPELMLHTGDLVYPDGTVEGYVERFFTPYAPLLARLPVFPCPGNHDYYHEQARFFVELHGVPRAGVPEEGHGRYYSFDWDNAHIVVLDSNTPLEEAAAGKGPMLEWLERDLAATRQFWKIAMFHHPPYAGGPNQDDPLSHLARRHIVPILERHGVQLVLSGHEHNYQRSHPILAESLAEPGDGIVYLTTGGGGAELYAPQPIPEAAFQERCHHFLDARIQGAELRVDAVRLDGAVIDQLQLNPGPRPSALVNAASLTEGVAPGGLCSLRGRQFAPREGDLGSVRIEVNGEAATVVAAAPDQVTFVMPRGAHGPATVRVATANGARSLDVTIAETAPAIFLIEHESGRTGMLFHSDGGLVTATKPARAGEELTLYLTGSGRAASLTLETGSAALDLGGQPVPEQPGVEVLRFRVPENAGDSIRLRAGDIASNVVPLWLARAAAPE